MRLSALTMTVIPLVVSVATADDPKAKAPDDPVRVKLEEAKKKYLTDVEKAGKKLLADFDTQRDVLKANKGKKPLSLDDLTKQVDVHDAEKKAFEAKQTDLPKSEGMKKARDTYEAGIKTARDVCEKAFADAKKAHGLRKDPKGNVTDEALAAIKAVEAERDEFFKGGPAVGEEKWTALINGKDAQGWAHASNQARTNASIVGKDGSLVLNGGGTQPAGHFVHDKENYDDFKLKVEGVASKNELDGILVRTAQRNGKWSGYLISMGAETAGAVAKFEPGVGFPLLLKAKKSTVKAGDTIKIEVAVTGNTFVVSIDGKEVVNAKEQSKFYDKGFVGLRCAFDSNLTVKQVEVVPAK
jgi:hypothetical protein